MTIAHAKLTQGTEDTQTSAPWLSLLLAYAAMLPVAAGAAASLVLTGNARALVIGAAVVWAGAVLCFLSGVRRGLSFRQPGGPTVAQIAAMLFIFVVGVAALLLMLVPGLAAAAIVLLLLGFSSLAVIDPEAAREREAPRYFARLRPAQMAVPVVSLLVLLARCLA